MVVSPHPLGLLFSFVVVICPAKHPACTEAKAAQVMREDNLGQFACDMKLSNFAQRMTPAFKARTRARCDWHEANRI